MRLVIELIVDCLRCKKSVTLYSNKTKVEGDPIAGWTHVKNGWICPEEEA